MSQDRLNGLASISIEQEIVHGLELDKVIDRFAELKAKKVPIMAI